MKQLATLCLLMVAFLTTSVVNAQKVFSDGTISYAMSVESTDPTAAMLNNSTFELAFLGNLSKVNGSVMGGLFGGDIILNGDAKNGLALLNLMGQKKAVKMTSSDISKAQVSSSGISASNIKYLNETKTIAGYKCTKAIIKDPEAQGELVVYLCESIQPKSGGVFDASLKDLKGFPLGIEIKSSEGKIVLMAKEVSHKVPNKSIFNQVVPSDYQVTTFEELAKQMGGAAPSNKEPKKDDSKGGFFRG